MIKRKLGINCDCIDGEDTEITLERIKKAGFECFFTAETNYEKVKRLKQKADELGLEFQFLHAPFKNINSMWSEDDSYQEIYNGMKECIDSASANGIPIVIMHLSSGWKAPEINDKGLARYDSLVDYAGKKGVTIAFENLRMIGNTAYFADRYAECDNVGFCYDCGHEHCYTKTVRWMDIFCERTIVTHIHDNFGRGKERVGSPDSHLIPFDGTIDYEKMMRKLDEYDYRGSLMLELINARPQYSEMSPDEYIQTAFERIKKISEL